MSDVKKGMVAYTDGSAIPNPGYSGSGIHGYVYDITLVDKPAIVESHYPTSTGYLPAQIPLKNQSHVKPTYYFDSAVPYAGARTNNYAEVAAVLFILQQVKSLGIHHVHINSDSQYAIKGITVGCPVWARTGWRRRDGSEIPNVELFKQIHSLIQELKSGPSPITLVIEWVKGHNGIFGNTHADALAAVGRRMAEQGEPSANFKMTESKGYWKVETERHPLMNLRRLYFNSLNDYVSPGRYYQAESGQSDMIFGKPVPESTFSVLHMNEPDELVELVRDRQIVTACGSNAIFMLNMDTLYSKPVFRLLNQFKQAAVVKDRRSFNLEAANESTLTIEQNPTGLTIRAIECIHHLEDLLERFKLYEAIGYDHPDNNIAMVKHDVTEAFFQQVEKKTKVVTELRPEFIVGYVEHPLTVKESYQGQSIDVQIPLLLGRDLPQRNNLKRLESFSPNLSLITWREAEMTLRYAMVITCSNANGIWANYYSNRIFLNNFLPR